MSKIKTVNFSIESDFENYVNNCLREGYKISSTSCGFLNSESYDFCACYQAILVKED